MGLKLVAQRQLQHIEDKLVLSHNVNQKLETDLAEQRAAYENQLSAKSIEVAGLTRQLGTSDYTPAPERFAGIPDIDDKVQ